MAPSTPPVAGRGERVLDGAYRLRLPLPFPGVPHGNAWALSAGDGIVLVDTGYHAEGSLRQLEQAMAQVGLRLDDVTLVVCTHGHADHCGQAATVAARTGCEVWMHPNRDHLTRGAEDPDAALRRRLEVGLASGVPEAPLRRSLEARREAGTGVAEPLEIARDLVPGVVVETDLGPLEVVETPGHAPSHVCLHQPERRLLLSGDHLLGRVSLYFDHGWTPDPVGEFLRSLDRVQALGVRLCLAGHARPFTTVDAHVEANRRLVAERLEGVRDVLAGKGPCPAFDVVPGVFGDALTPQTAGWLLTMTLCFLDHLELRGEAVRLEPEADGAPQLWAPGAA